MKLQLQENNLKMKKSLQVLYKNKIATGQYMKERQKDKKRKCYWKS